MEFVLKGASVGVCLLTSDTNDGVCTIWGVGEDGHCVFSDKRYGIHVAVLVLTSER